MHIFEAWDPLAQRLTYALLHFVWQGLVIALALVLIVRLCRVRHPEWRYCFSLAALLAMLTSPVVTLLLIDLPIRSISVAADSTATSMATAPSQPIEGHLPGQTEEPSFGPAADRSISLIAAPTDPTRVSAEPVPLPQNRAAYPTLWQQVQPWIVALWTVGVGLLSTRLLIGWIGIWRLRSRGITPPEGLIEQLQTLAIELKMTAPELRLSHHVSEAIALGFLRPLVLLPAAWVTQMPPDMLEAVLAHELAHIRRRDLWINLFQRLVETLLFYHPAVWWLSRRLRMERELCCDELVVQMTQNPLRYAETLEHIGRLSLRSTPVNLTVSILGSRSILSARIRNILRLRPQEQSSWAWLAGALPLLLAGVVYWSVTSGNNSPAHAEDDKPAAALAVDGLIADESIVELRIAGNVAVSDDEIRKHIKSRPGQELMPRGIKDDVDALIRTRWFAHVEPKIDYSDKGVVLTFQVLERPTIRSVEYKGNSKIKAEDLNKLTELKAGQPYDVSVNRECLRRIQDRYREKGFPFVTVELERGDVQGDPDREVIFLITEGPKFKVTKVDFEGDKTFYDPLRKTKTGTKTQILWLSAGKYDPSTIDDDIEGVRNYYHRMGYFDVQITPEQEFSEDKSKVQVHYKIDEGLRYRINEITVTGNDVLSEGEVRELMKVKPGDEYNERQINKDVESIKAKYGAQGRLFAQVVPIRKWSEEPGVLDLVYRINEDKVYRVREVQDSTKESQVRGPFVEKDKNLDDTRRLSFAAADPSSPMIARVLDGHSQYRQRREYVSGVKVLLEDPAQKWQMVAEYVLVEMDVDTAKSAANSPETGYLESDKYVLSTKLPLKMTLKGKVSIWYSKEKANTSTKLKADQVVLDFQHQQFQAERVQLSSEGNYFEGNRLIMPFASLMFPPSTGPTFVSPPAGNSSKEPQSHSHAKPEDDGRTYPYQAIVEVDGEYVRSGPGTNFYPTDTLRKGDKVVVHRRYVGGWCMISPPPSSFSWIKAEHVERMGENRGILKANRVTVHVGSSLNMDDFKTIQGNLSRGDAVEILDEKNFPFDDGPKLMYKISPVRGEWRWIQRSALVGGDPIRLGSDELPLLREQRQRTNDRVLSKSLVGEWVLDLPAGASFPVTITQREDGCVTLGNSRNLSGTFAYQDKRLKLIEPSQSGIDDLIWEQQADGWFKLIHEQHNVGAKYVGATLSKGGILSCAGIERQLLKTFPESRLEVRSSPQKVIVRGLARDHDERSRIMAAVVSRVNELQQARKGQGVEIIDEMHFPSESDTNPGRPLFGVGVNGNSGLVGNIVLRDQNVGASKPSRAARIRANDREAASSLAGRWLLTLPSQELFDVELKVSDDGCLALACRKECRLAGRYALNGNQLELVEHANADIDLVWRLEGQNTLKLTEERPAADPSNVGAKLERIAAVAGNEAQANVFQIPAEVLAQTRELAAAYRKTKGSLKARRPAGLEDLESPDAIKRAIERAMLMLSDPQKESDGVVQLRYLGDEAFEALVVGSKSENVRVATLSCSVLEHRGLKAVAPLCEALKSSTHAAVRSTVASALGQTYRQAAVPALIAALDDSDTGVRGAAINALRYPRDPQAIAPLQRFVNDPGMGHVAVESIRHIQKAAGYAWWPADTLDLRQICQDAHTLKGERYSEAELQRLTTGLKSDEGTVVYHCLFALGHLGSAESVAAIIQAPLSGMKFHALTEIATPEAVEYLIQRLHSRHAQTRELAIQGLADGADRWATPLLIALLDDPTLKLAGIKLDPLGPAGQTWPESHRAHSALYSLFSRFGLKGEWRNLYLNQSNNVPDEITRVKAWWKQHGPDFLAGKAVPSPNLTTVFYNDP